MVMASKAFLVESRTGKKEKERTGKEVNFNKKKEKKFNQIHEYIMYTSQKTSFFSNKSTKEG